MAHPQDNQPDVDAMWRELLTHGHRTRLAILPSSPRCTVCLLPFGGVGGTITRMLGRKPSRKSPNLCNT